MAQDSSSPSGNRMPRIGPNKTHVETVKRIEKATIITHDRTFTMSKMPDRYNGVTIRYPSDFKSQIQSSPPVAMLMGRIQ